MTVNTLLGDTSFMGYAAPPAGTSNTVGASPRVQAGGTVVVDGTPIRVVMIAVAAAAAVTALRWSGVRFNVGASI